MMNANYQLLSFVNLYPLIRKMDTPRRYGLRTRVISISECVNPSLPVNTIEYHGLTFESKWMSKPVLTDSKEWPTFYRCKTADDLDNYDYLSNQVDGHKKVDTYECMVEVVISGLYQSEVVSAVCTWEQITEKTGLVKNEPAVKQRWRWARDQKGNTFYPNFGVLNSKLITKLNTFTMEAPENV